jgi:hypothetical protein
MALADPWIYPYTDFGEGTGKLDRPLLRAVVQVGTPSSSSSFAAIVDTGGPLTVVASGVLLSGGDPIDTGRTMLLRLGGTSNEVPLYELTLEIRPPQGSGCNRSYSLAKRRCRSQSMATSGHRCHSWPIRLHREFHGHFRPFWIRCRNRRRL